MDGNVSALAPDRDVLARLSGGLGSEASQEKLGDEPPRLRDYQIEGAWWLATQKLALLADEMGLGKSAQAIMAADELGLKRLFVVCPAVGRVNWLREFQKFSVMKRPFHIVRSEGSFSWAAGYSIICPYNLVSRVPLEHIGRFDALIVDEVHMAKNPEATRTQAIFGKNGLVRKADRVWTMSGTPAPNHAAELWVLLYTFGLTKLTYTEFAHEFCNCYNNGFSLFITGTKVEKIRELKRLLAPVIKRRRKDEVVKELPPISYGAVVVDPGQVDLEVESSLVQWVFPTDRKKELERKLHAERELVRAIVEGGGSNTDIARGLEAIAKSVSTLRMYTGIQKVNAAAELIKEELETGAYEKIVVFALHQAVIEGLRLRLAKYNPVTYYGGTPESKKQRHIDKFQNEPKYRVFIGNIHACGTSITLTAAHHVLFVEEDWTPGNNAQAAMRCHRLGQTNPVTVRFVRLSNSLDERIVAVHQRKTQELTKIFDES